MLHAFWLFIAAFGSIIFLGPIFIGICIYLWRTERKREATMRFAIVVLCAISIFFLKKIGTFHFYIGPQQIRALSAPSGHAGISLIFWGQIASLMWQRWPSGFGRLMGFLPIVLVVMIDIAIYVLWWHSLFDITAGTLLSLGFLAALRFLNRSVEFTGHAERPSNRGASGLELWRHP